MSEYRVSTPWIHLKTMEQCFSVQKRVSPRKWINCCKGDDALFFKTIAEAQAFIRSLQKGGNNSE